MVDLINSNACYQNPRDMRFLRANQLYFNNDVFFCAMVLLSIENKNIYVNTAYVYVTGFTLAEPT